MVLSPELPPCPPSNLAAHIQLLARIAFNPPAIDEETLMGLIHAEKTLKKGSKSFDVAKLAFGREMRIGLVAVYAWCRMTVCSKAR
jgi:15-cis-phytoene synthase/lycopene beta-cyclase